MRRRDFLGAAGSGLGVVALALAPAGCSVMPSFDQTPDKPQSFGYKVSWFAVEASDPALVLDALGLEKGTPANWASGLAAAGRQRRTSAQSKRSDARCSRPNRSSIRTRRSAVRVVSNSRTYSIAWLSPKRSKPNRY